MGYHESAPGPGKDRASVPSAVVFAVCEPFRRRCWVTGNAGGCGVGRETAQRVRRALEAPSTAHEVPRVMTE